MTAEAIEVDAVGRMTRLTLGELPDECLIEATIIYQPGAYQCGLLLRADDELEHYYQVRLEPARQRLTVDRWPRPGDEAFMIERPLTMSAGQPIRLQVLLAGTCLVVYANEEVALSCRMYDHRAGNLGLFVTEGQALFERVGVSVRAEK